MNKDMKLSEIKILSEEIAMLNGNVMEIIRTIRDCNETFKYDYKQQTLKRLKQLCNDLYTNEFLYLSDTFVKYSYDKKEVEKLRELSIKEIDKIIRKLKKENKLYNEKMLKFLRLNYQFISNKQC